MWKASELKWKDFELTSFCNIRCPQCFREEKEVAEQLKNKNLISLDIINKKFTPILFPKVNHINFCGSIDEPTTHPEFLKICNYFKDWNDDMFINIATNGSLRTTKWWAELPKYLPKKHNVVFGIDGSDKLSEVYRRGSNFNKVRENWRAFINAGGTAIWQFIVMEHNKHQLDTAKQLAKDEGFLKFKTIYSHRKNTETIKYNHKKQISETPEIKCHYLKDNRIFVNHLGNIIPCCFLNSKMLEYGVLKNVKDRFEKIISDNGDLLGNNIAYNTVPEIIEGDVFSEIIDSWSDGNYIPKCKESCQVNNRDNFKKVSL